MSIAFIVLASCTSTFIGFLFGRHLSRRQVMNMAYNASCTILNESMKALQEKDREAADKLVEVMKQIGLLREAKQ